MKTLLKSVLPKFMLRPLLLLHRSGLAQREHEYLTSIGQSIRPELSRNAILLVDRMALLDRMPKRARVAEIGVATGAFSARILSQTKPEKLHLIDPWDSPIQAYSGASLDKIRLDRKSDIDAGIVKLHCGYSCDMLSEFEDNYFDWVYLDAAHDYQNVKNDLEALFPKVKPGGLICGHDYVKWASPMDRYGVLEAVNEFINHTGSNFLYLTNQLDKHDNYCLQLNK